jgi:NTE family protein
MKHRPRIGLALGSGAARGWAHIGVLRALHDVGLEPDIVCGTSMGALVAAAYACDRLDHFEAWARDLDRRTVFGFFDLSLQGGLIEGRRIFDVMAEDLPNVPIESLPKPFGAVATELDTGAEVWMQRGSLRDACRASSAMPGLVAPLHVDGRWLTDGGLVNPVPVALCRALGAEAVIAVELGAGVLNNPLILQEQVRTGQAIPTADAPPAPRLPPPEEVVEGTEAALAADAPGMIHALRDLRDTLLEAWSRAAPEGGEGERPPSFYDVIVKTLLIMQVRITRSRMAGDPPELHVIPRLQNIGLMEFDRAAEAIHEGYRAVEVALAAQADFHALRQG